ncbi:MAG: dethiobiotin synthase [Gammaproteobacteria bacterium]
MIARSIFVTGTDTGVGKTRVACALLRRLAGAGQRCAGFKPVAAGVVPTDAGPRHEDALALNAAASVKLPYDLLNPYCLPAALAPHIAAAELGRELTRAPILAAHRAIVAQADWIVIEGAGGWRVPLNKDETMAELVAEAGWPVILVVGMRLGCLNHALLSAESIGRTNRLLGWIANELPPPQPALEQNIATLETRLPAPRLARMRAQALDLEWTPRGNAALGF